MKSRIILILALFGLLAACQQAADTPIVPTDLPPKPSSSSTMTMTATDKPIVPTDTSPEPTTTPLPSPTMTMTPTPDKFPPVISGLSDQTVTEGEKFERINLPDCISDADHAPEEIVWDFSGNEELRVRPAGDAIVIASPQSEWAGSETITFQACDPDGLCDAVEIVFTIIEENDLPVVSVSDQAIQPTGAFENVVLADAAEDEDHADEELTWQIEGNDQLQVQITEGLVSVTPPDETWTGSETIRFQACDPQGGCGLAEAQFTVLGATDVLVTYVFNSGFMITTGDKKILVDALHDGLASRGGEGPSKSLIQRLEQALPPFDNVDLILATHEDVDHFKAGMVQRHMENNPNAIFVSTSRTVGLLDHIPGLQDRLIALDLVDGESTELTVKGIEIEAIYLTHGVGRPNLGYIFSVGGKKLFHTGDLYVELIDVSYIQDYGIQDRGIDVAFVPIFSLHPERNHREIFASFQAEQLILMHYFFPYDDANLGLMDDYFPDAIRFRRELESWMVP